ncbi:MAG: 16S rRNA (cytidine(1402)-2'-O)-methyltransferase [Alphaproteobacteria bacterium]|nr:16S rRNA (cytidine(1402)-2'-O)-methyltransferase [Alphaproteobacteria bacterium]
MTSKSPAKSNVPSALYVVATPIGNLKDMTYRAVETLKSVAVVACEDTRTSHVLLQHYGIETPTLSFHEHNSASMQDTLITRLAAGESIALLSDAGTPLVSDPGESLVKAVWETGHRVIPIPGASATMTALSAAGVATDGFYFAGFLPTKASEREARLAFLRALPVTIIMFEAPHRILETLEHLLASLGNRTAVIARELTKTYETFHRGTLASLAETMKEKTPKGEMVLLVEPAVSEGALQDSAMIDTLLKDALTRLPKSAAAAEVAKATGLTRQEIYARAIALSTQ